MQNPRQICEILLKTDPINQHYIQLLIAIDTSMQLLRELSNSDNIIKNCINNLNEKQRHKVVQMNQADRLSNGWVFRSHQREQLISRAQRVLGVALHE